MTSIKLVNQVLLLTHKNFKILHCYSSICLSLINDKTVAFVSTHSSLIICFVFLDYLLYKWIVYLTFFVSIYTFFVLCQRSSLTQPWIFLFILYLSIFWSWAAPLLKLRVSSSFSCFQYLISDIVIYAGAQLFCSMLFLFLSIVFISSFCFTKYT